MIPTTKYRPLVLFVAILAACSSSPPSDQHQQRPVEKPEHHYTDRELIHCATHRLHLSASRDRARKFDEIVRGVRTTLLAPDDEQQRKIFGFEDWDADWSPDSITDLEVYSGPDGISVEAVAETLADAREWSRRLVTTTRVDDHRIVLPRTIQPRDDGRFDVVLRDVSSPVGPLEEPPELEDCDFGGVETPDVGDDWQRTDDRESGGWNLVGRHKTFELPPTTPELQAGRLRIAADSTDFDDRLSSVFSETEGLDAAAARFEDDHVRLQLFGVVPEEPTSPVDAEADRQNLLEAVMPDYDSVLELPTEDPAWPEGYVPGTVDERTKARLDDLDRLGQLFEALGERDELVHRLGALRSQRKNVLEALQCLYRVTTDGPENQGDSERRAPSVTELSYRPNNPIEWRSSAERPETFEELTRECGQQLDVEQSDESPSGTLQVAAPTTGDSMVPDDWRVETIEEFVEHALDDTHPQHHIQQLEQQLAGLEDQLVLRTAQITSDPDGVTATSTRLAERLRTAGGHLTAVELDETHCHPTGLQLDLRLRGQIASENALPYLLEVLDVVEHLVPVRLDIETSEGTAELDLLVATSIDPGVVGGC